jgi:SAM-dependent methyltransferase
MVSFEMFLDALKRCDIDPSQACALEVGGTEHVSLLKGRVARIEKNPLLSIIPNLKLVDLGYNVDRFQTTTTERVDFLDLQVIERMRDQFDLVVSFETLEHVTNPFRLCEHLAYVTRPGGYIWVSTVFSYVYHPSPEDYFRFSPAGLKQCFLDKANSYCDQLQVVWAGWDGDDLGVSALAYKQRDKNSTRTFQMPTKPGSLMDRVEKRSYWVIRNTLRVLETAGDMVTRQSARVTHFMKARSPGFLNGRLPKILP